MSNAAKLGNYTVNQRESETLRETEAHALLNCASRLEKARTAPMDEYIAAIKHNQQLWTIFQVCVCEPDNMLPRELKLLILNLSRFVDRASFRALAEYLPASLGSLIDINRTIAAGLSVKPKTAESGKGNAGAGQTTEKEDYSPVMTSI